MGITIHPLIFSAIGRHRATPLNVDPVSHSLVLLKVFAWVRCHHYNHRHLLYYQDHSKEFS